MIRYCRASNIIAVTLCLCLFGCSLSPLARHTAAFSSATSLVVQNSTDAYRAAVDLHGEEQVSAGVIKFEQHKPWDPALDKPLLSEAALKTRLDVLAALSLYAQTLSDLTSGVDSPALDAAAKASGASVQALSASATTDDRSLISPLNAQSSNIISTSALALGEYLVGRKVKSEVPRVIKQMDKPIGNLCLLLEGDVDLLRIQAKADFSALFAQQRTFIIDSEGSLSPLERRAEIERLPSITRRAQATDVLLLKLRSAITELALTHNALAAAAQGNNPEALRARIAELQAAGANLGQFYQALPTK